MPEGILALYQNLETSFLTHLPNLVMGVASFLFFYLVAMGLRFLLNKSRKKQATDKQLVLQFLSKLSSSILIIIGFITMLGTWGIDVSALVAGLGLTGFALGFALKDALSSTLAGILVLLYKPFSIGDHLTMGSIKGHVIHIDMRYTTLKNGKSTHLIPNGKLLKETISILPH